MRDNLPVDNGSSVLHGKINQPRAGAPIPLSGAGQRIADSWYQVRRGDLLKCH